MRTRTVGQLTGSVRARGDYEDDSSDDYQESYIDSAMMLDFLDSAHAESWDILVDADPDRYVGEYTFTTAAGQEQYVLPDDFYRLRAVDMNTSSGSTDYHPIDRYELAERDCHPSSTTTFGWPSETFVYRVEGSYLRVRPAPGDTRNVRLTYNPTAMRLTSSAQVVDTVNGHDELTVLLALRRCRVRAEESTSEVDSEIERQTRRLVTMTSDRDRSMPRRLGHPRRRRYRW